MPPTYRLLRSTGSVDLATSTSLPLAWALRARFRIRLTTRLGSALPGCATRFWLQLLLQVRNHPNNSEKATASMYPCRRTVRATRRQPSPTAPQSFVPSTLAPAALRAPVAHTVTKVSATSKPDGEAAGRWGRSPSPPVQPSASISVLFS